MQQFDDYETEIISAYEHCELQSVATEADLVKINAIKPLYAAEVRVCNDSKRVGTKLASEIVRGSFPSSIQFITSGTSSPKRLSVALL